MIIILNKLIEKPT